MEVTAPKRRVRIGILTQPVSDKIEPDELKPPDQYILDPLKSWLEASGAECVPLRYDLINTKDLLCETLDCVDGVLFTGGFLQIKNWNKMPTITSNYYNCAKEIFRGMNASPFEILLSMFFLYCIKTNLPLLGICQGF